MFKEIALATLKMRAKILSPFAKQRLSQRSS